MSELWCQLFNCFCSDVEECIDKTVLEETCICNCKSCPKAQKI